MAKLLLICSCMSLIRRFLMLLIDHPNPHPDPDPDPEPRVRTVRVVLIEVGRVAGGRGLLVEIVNIEVRH